MTDEEELDSIQKRFTPEDLTAIKRLRNYYRKNFERGESDDCFKLWLEDGLRLLDEPVHCDGGMQG